MMTYKELNLKKLREDNDLDFAHYTYRRGMCSCCYGPTDLAARYWRDGVKPDTMPNRCQYILFKNADNGSGHVTANDTICIKREKRYPYETKYSVCISWDFPEEKLDGVLRSLREQLDKDYLVLRPVSKDWCIKIVLRECFPNGEDEKKDYTVFE